MIWQPLRNRMQSELIRRGHCVGCTRNLSDADREESIIDGNYSLVSCRCRRIYLYDKRLNNYRRALLEDVDKHSS